MGKQNVCWAESVISLKPAGPGLASAHSGYYGQTNPDDFLV